MLFVWIIILGLLQSVTQLGINFLALFAIFAGFKKGLLWGLFIGIFTGVFAEILSSSTWGLNLALYSGIGLLSGIIRQRLYYKEGPGVEFLFSFFGLLFFYLAYSVFTRTAQAVALPVIIFSSLISPLFFRVMDLNYKETT